MTKNDSGHVNNLDDKQIELLKTYWLSLISEINKDSGKFLDELFFLFAGDNPDMILLRWLRARQWNISSAVQMMLNTLEWRIDFNIKQLLKNAENDLLDEEMRANKTYHMGKDLQGHPITYVHACEHIKGQYPFEFTKKFVILNMELGRYLSENSIEQGAVVLDMSNIKYQNLDYQHIQFMINAMQNSYPECLAKALIVNAPRGFSTVWNIIRLWLDPNVSQKIVFLKTSEDLFEFIDPKWIPKRLNGNHQDFQYIPANENDKSKMNIIQNDRQRFDRLLQEHQQAVKDYLDLTLKWAKTSKDNQQELVMQRNHAEKILSECFQRLLPFVFSETVYHRQGLIQLPIYDLTYQQILDDQQQTTHF